MAVVFGNGQMIGSPAKMYELLLAASARAPVPDNAEGSYLTFRSQGAIIFGIINIVGNFATVFNDQVSVSLGR